MESVEIHVAACARCQALVGAMARGVPSVVIADRPSGFRFWSWWLAPVGRGNSCKTLSIVVPEQQQLATAPPVPSVDAPAREVGVRESAQAESNAAAPVPAPQQVPRTANQNALKDRAGACGSVRRTRQSARAASDSIEDKNEQATGKLAAEERAATTADAVTAAPAAAPAGRQSRHCRRARDSRLRRLRSSRRIHQGDGGSSPPASNHRSITEHPGSPCAPWVSNH